MFSYKDIPINEVVLSATNIESRPFLPTILRYSTNEAT